MKWRLRDGVQKEEGLNCTGTCFGFAENIFWFFWRCILKGIFEQEIRCNYICNKGVLGTWKHEHRELFRDDVWEQHAVN